MSEAKAVRIRELNDQFRRHLIGGRVVFTSGIGALGQSTKDDIVAKVRTFNTFTEDNDPWGEHDFGAFEIEGRKVFWKLDYYDPGLEAGSEDPSDPEQTTRVMTIMLAEEY